MDKKMRSIQKTLILMDWLNAWYSGHKEQQELAQEEYYRMLEEEE